MRPTALASLVLSLSIGLAGSSRAQTAEECFTIAGIEWIAASGLAFVAPTPADFLASAGAYSANLLLKECEAKLDPPPDVSRQPNTADGCGYDFDQPIIKGNYESNVDELSILFAAVNALDGIELSDLSRETLDAPIGTVVPFNIPPVFDQLLDIAGANTYPYVRPGNPLLSGLGLAGGFPVWGELGTARVSHFNTTVEVRLVIPPGVSREGSSIVLPLGEHFLRWEADTLRSPLDLYNLPIPKIEAKKRDRKVRRVVSAALEAISAAKTIVIRGIRYGQGAGVQPIKDIFDPKPHGVANSTVQLVRVFDDVAPTISAPPGVTSFEALDIGGTRLSRNIDALRDAVVIADDCRNQEDLELVLDTSSFVPVDDDFLVPLGQHTLSWTVRDPGPNSSSPASGPIVRNETTTTQTIVVEDTFAPSLLPPPNRLIVSPTAIPVGDVELGSPRLFDLADPFLSVIEAELPISGEFAVNERTQTSLTASSVSGKTTG